mgnify:FL=1
MPDLTGGTTFTSGQSVTHGDLNNLVGNATINDNAVVTAKINNSAVTTAKILDANVTTAKVADDAITYAKIQDTATDNRLLGAATAGEVGEVQVATDMVADNAITPAKMEDGTQGDVLVYGADGAPERLGTGTSGQVLTAGGTGATASWTTPSVSTPVPLVKFFDSGADEDWTVPTGVTRVKVSVQGGGGAGYSSTTSGNANDDGGAGGAYFEKTFSVTAGDTIAVVAAANATGNDAGIGSGPYSATDGNNSSITYDSVTYQANGGGGGRSNNTEVAGGSVTGTVDISVSGRSNHNGGFPGSGYLGQYGAGGYNAASPSTSSDIGHGGFVKIEY